MVVWDPQWFTGGVPDRWLKMQEEMTAPLAAFKAQQQLADLSGLTRGAGVMEAINEQMRLDTSAAISSFMSLVDLRNSQLAEQMAGFRAGIAEKFMMSSSPAMEAIQQQLAEASSWSEAFKDRFLKQYDDLFKGFAIDVAQRIGKLQRYALPDNLWDLDDDLSVRDIRSFLNEDPYPVYNVPRASIVSKFIKAQAPGERRELLNRKDMPILQDCEKALDSLDQQSFADEIDHVLQSIEAYNHGLVRPAQTGLTIVLDSLFNRAMRLKTVQTEVKNQGELGEKALAKLQTADFLVWAPVRQAHLEFDGRKSEPPPRQYSRHGTVHSVQKRQYSKRNVVYALLVVTSLMTWLDEREPLVEKDS